MMLMWIVAAIVIWIVIFGGRVHVAWKRRESITFTLSLYSPRRRIRPKGIESNESAQA